MELITNKMKSVNCYGINQSDADIIRQLGYATDQTVIEDGKVVTYTVEQLVNEGVFKLNK